MNHLADDRKSAQLRPELPPIIAHSEALKEVVELGRTVAPTRLPVLLVGRTGCGKELFAQHIHRWSGRQGNVVAVNCAALPESLIESELFGHGPSAFTGARHARPGLVELADRQSFFLDEVTALAWALQGKLLRVLETQELRRVGETATRSVDVRFIAAAQEDLWDRMTEKTFRDDLYHRLAGCVLRIPPLSERREDILPLARHFSTEAGFVLDEGAERELFEYGWPGNVRELRMVIERAGCLADGPTISAAAVQSAMALGALSRGNTERANGDCPRGDEIREDAQRHPMTLDHALRAAERLAIQRALTFAAGDRDRAAAALGISLATLYRRMSRLEDSQR